MPPSRPPPRPFRILILRAWVPCLKFWSGRSQHLFWPACKTLLLKTTNTRTRAPPSLKICTKGCWREAKVLFNQKGEPTKFWRGKARINKHIGHPHFLTRKSGLITWVLSYCWDVSCNFLSCLTPHVKMMLNKLDSETQDTATEKGKHKHANIYSMQILPQTHTRKFSKSNRYIDKMQINAYINKRQI